MVFAFVSIFMISYSLIAMERANDASIFRLGDGEGDTMHSQCKAQFEQALTNIERAKKVKGAARTLVQFGCMYYKGYGVVADYARAKGYFEQAERQDENKSAKADACAYLGFMYYQGHGVPKDYVLAREYFQKAERLEVDMDAASWLWLGRMYHYGEGGPVDYVRAKKCFEKVAKDDFNYEKIKALSFLMKMYYERVGKIDSCLAIEHLSKAEEQDTNKNLYRTEPLLKAQINFMSALIAPVRLKTLAMIALPVPFFFCSKITGFYFQDRRSEVVLKLLTYYNCLLFLFERSQHGLFIPMKASGKY